MFAETICVSLRTGGELPKGAADLPLPSHDQLVQQMKALQADRALGQNKMAKLVGISSQGQYSKWLQGKLTDQTAADLDGKVATWLQEQQPAPEGIPAAVSTTAASSTAAAASHEVDADGDASMPDAPAGGVGGAASSAPAPAANPGVASTGATSDVQMSAQPGDDAAAPESPVLTVVNRDARSEKVEAFNTGGMPPDLFKTHGIDLTPNARKGPTDFYNLELKQQKTPPYARSFQLHFRPPTAQLYLAEDQKGRLALWVANVKDEAGAKAIKEDLKSFLEKPANSSTPTDAAPTSDASSSAALAPAADDVAALDALSAGPVPSTSVRTDSSIATSSVSSMSVCERLHDFQQSVRQHYADGPKSIPFLKSHAGQWIDAIKRVRELPVDAIVSVRVDASLVAQKGEDAPTYSEASQDGNHRSEHDLEDDPQQGRRFHRQSALSPPTYRALLSCYDDPKLLDVTLPVGPQQPSSSPGSVGDGFGVFATASALFQEGVESELRRRTTGGSVTFTADRVAFSFAGVEETEESTADPTSTLGRLAGALSSGARCSWQPNSQFKPSTVLKHLTRSFLCSQAQAPTPARSDHTTTAHLRPVAAAMHGPSPSNPRSHACARIGTTFSSNLTWPKWNPSCKT